MNEQITITHVDNTVEADNKVYKVEGDDGQLHCIPVPEMDEMYVPTIMCPRQTRFSDLLTAAVEKFEITTIKIPTVLNDELIKKLDGFEKTTEIHEGLGEPVDVWVGEWENEL